VESSLVSAEGADPREGLLAVVDAADVGSFARVHEDVLAEVVGAKEATFAFGACEGFLARVDHSVTREVCGEDERTTTPCVRTHKRTYAAVCLLVFGQRGLAGVHFGTVLVLAHVDLLSPHG